MIKSKFYLSIISLLLVVVCSSHTERNLLCVWVKADGKLIVEGESLDLSKLKDMVKLWVLNPNYEDAYPEKRIIEVQYFGVAEASRVVVSVQCDRETTYGFYVAVRNEIEKAYNELRDDLAKIKFGVSYNTLPEGKQRAINRIYPKRISEAEPNWVRNKDGQLVENRSWYYWCY